MNNVQQKLENLREQVAKNSKFGGSQKFSLKVWYCLHFTQQFPEYVNIIGIVWRKDNNHFLVNSDIFGSFLNLKPNSINTNFRDHGFVIVPLSSRLISEEFPNLGKSRNWKQRVNVISSFCSTTDISIIAKIPCFSATKTLRHITITDEQNSIKLLEEPSKPLQDSNISQLDFQIHTSLFANPDQVELPLTFDENSDALFQLYS